MLRAASGAVCSGNQYPIPNIRAKILCFAPKIVELSRHLLDVEELLAQRGIVVSYETVRQWCLKFGQTYANELKRRRLKTGDKWYLDEVYLKINGKTHSL